MGEHVREDLVTLGQDWPVWDRVFTVNPLVLIGTRERERWIRPRPQAHGVPHGLGELLRVRLHPAPRDLPQRQARGRLHRQLSEADAGRPREPGGITQRERRFQASLYALPTFPASEVDGVFIQDAYLFLECVLDRIVDDFGENSLIAGRVVAAHVSEDYLRASERDDNDLIHESRYLPT